MEFLASLAIKALIGTSICGTVSVGAVYGYDKTLLGFKDNTKTTEGDRDETPSGGTDSKNKSVQTPGKDDSTNVEGGVVATNKVATNNNPITLVETTDEPGEKQNEGVKALTTEEAESENKLTTSLVDGEDFATTQEPTINKVVDSTASLPGSSTPKIEPTTTIGEIINVAAQDNQSAKTGQV